MISQAAEYSLRAVLCLASDSNRPLTTHQIAQRTGVPSSYLAKVLHSLGRAGLIVSQRGLHGGHSLKRPPDQVTLMDVVQAAEKSRWLEVSSPNGSGYPSPTSNGGLGRIATTVQRALMQTTISTILAELASHSEYSQESG